MNEYDFESILAALEHHEVRFILIGGLAAIVSGSPFPTEDVDVTPERSLENLQRLSDALSDMDARLYTTREPLGLEFGHDGASLDRADVWNLATRFGRLDISFRPNGTDGYADLKRDAFDFEIAGISVRVASLADVIRSKQAANRPKDQRVLPTLREILASRHERGSGGGRGSR